MSFAATLRIPGFAVSPDRAESVEAQSLRQFIRKISEFPNSIALGEPRRAVHEALDAAYEAAEVDDWDRAGARRVEPTTYMYAYQFLGLLPSSASPPEVTVDSDGEILFEWDHGRRKVFSVSVGRDGTLTYAGLFGHAKIHGTEPLYEGLPLVISDSLERVSAPADR